MAGHHPHRLTRVTRRERAALVGLVAGSARRLEAERSIEELAGLADAAGADVVLRVLQERPKPDPSTFLGSGKIKMLAGSCAEAGVDIVIFDNELTPAQLRQIEEDVDRKIIDRIVDGLALAPRLVSGLPLLVHNGLVPSYALIMWIGLLMCVLFAMRVLPY